MSAGLAYSLYLLHVRPNLCRTSASEVAVCDLRRCTSVIFLCLCICLIYLLTYLHTYVATFQMVSSPNAYTYSNDTGRNVSGNVLTLQLNGAGGMPISVTDSGEPFELWMDGMPTA